MLETSHLFKYPQSCMFGVFHEESKTVVLYDTINFFKTLGELLNSIQNNSCHYPELHDYRNQLVIKVINSDQNLDTRRQMFSKELETLSNSGYTVLNKRKTLVKYKLRKIMTRYKQSAVVCVVRVNLRNEKTILGLFRNTIEADEFMNPLMSLDIIPEVYADNDLTKDYLNSKLKIGIRL